MSTKTKGIETTHRADGSRSYKFVLLWANPESGETDRIKITCESPYQGNAFTRAHGVPEREQELTGLKAAKAMKADYEKAREHPEFLPPKLWKERNQARLLDETLRQRDLKPLVFHAVKKVNADGDTTFEFKGIVKRFSEHEADGLDARYKRSHDARLALCRLGLDLNGERIDLLTKQRVRKLWQNRVDGKGAFKSIGPVTSRAMQSDWTILRGLFDFAACNDERFGDLECPEAPKRRGGLKQPKAREKVIPSAEQLIAIFDAERKAKPGGNGAAGRDLILDDHRALWRLCYETAARPESEPCRLTCGDVKPQKDGTATVRYRDAKNEQSDRTVPISKTLAGLLRSITAGRKKSDPVFGTVDRNDNVRPWDRYSYRKAWRGTVDVVEGIEGMVLRDLRATARTVLADDDSISFELAERFMGHEIQGVAGRYIRLKDFTRCAKVLQRHVRSLRAVGSPG